VGLGEIQPNNGVLLITVSLQGLLFGVLYSPFRSIQSCMRKHETRHGVFSAIYRDTGTDLNGRVLAILCTAMLVCSTRRRILRLT
jgi:hypothetical protein